MRLLFTAILIFLIAWQGWWKPRAKRERVGNRFTKAKTPVKLLVTLSIFLLLIGGSEARWQYLQYSASSALKEVTENPDATLKCQRLSESWIDMDSGSIGGKVYGDSVNTARMKYSECADLFMWMQSLNKSSPSQKQVWAIHVLTHEGVHTTGEFDEAVTECTAIQRDDTMATALGATEETGLSFQKNYYDSYFPRMSPSYRLSGCSIDDKFDSLLNPTRVGN